MAYQDLGIRFVVLGFGELNRLNSSLATTERSIKSMSGSLSNWGNSLSNVGRQITMSVTLPIVALGAGVLKAGIDFEDSFAGISKTVEGVSDDFGVLTASGELLAKEFRNLALEIPLSVNELNRIGEVGGQLGIIQSQLVGFTDTVAKLSVTTNLTSEQAATDFARLANIMGISADDMAAYVLQTGNVVVELGNNAATTESEIMSLSLRIAGAGRVVGLTTPEILALSAELSALGIRAEMGGSAISRIFLEMKRTTDSFTASGGEATDQLKLMSQIAGMTTAEFVSLVKNSPAEAFTQLVKGLNEWNLAGKVSQDTLKTLNFDTVRLEQVLNALGPNYEQLTKFVDMANDEWTDGNALQVEAQKKFNTTKSQLILLKNAFIDLGITVFNMFYAPIRAAVSVVRLFVVGLNKLNAGVLKTAINILALAAALGPTLMLFGRLLNFSLLLAGPFKLVGIAVVVATAGITAFSVAYENNLGNIKTISKGVIKELQGVFYWISEAFKYGKNTFDGKNIFGGISAALKSLTYIYSNNKRTFFSNVLYPFGLGGNASEELGLKIRNFLAPILLKASNAFRVLGFWVGKFKEDISKSGIVEAIKNIFKPIEIYGTDVSYSPFESILLAFGASEETIINFRNAIDTITNEIVPKLVDFGKVVAEVLFSVSNFLFTKVLPIFSEVVSFIVLEFAPALLDALLPAFINLAKGVQNLWNIIEPPLSDLLNWFKDTALPLFEKFLMDKLIPALKDFGEAIDLDDTALISIGVALAVFSSGSIISSVSGVAAAIASVGAGALAAAPPLLLLSIIILALGTNFGGVTDDINRAGTSLKEGDYTEALDAIKETLIDIPKGIAGVILASEGIDVDEGLSYYEGVWINLKTIIKWLGEIGVNNFISSVQGLTQEDIATFINVENIIWKIWKWINDLIISIPRFAKKIEQIHIPTSLQEFHDIIKDLYDWFSSPVGKIIAEAQGINFPFRAGGGPIDSPTIVGEKGPEVFIPGSSGYVINNQLTKLLADINGLRGGNTNTYNNQQVFAPNISGVPMSNEQDMSTEILRAYRMATLT